MRDGHLYQMEVSFSRIKAGRLPISRPDLPAPLRSDLEHQSWFQTNQWNSHELHRVFVRKRKIHQLDVLECYFLSFFFAVFFCCCLHAFELKISTFIFGQSEVNEASYAFARSWPCALPPLSWTEPKQVMWRPRLGPKLVGGVFFGGCCWWKKSQTTT